MSIHDFVKNLECSSTSLLSAVGTLRRQENVSSILSTAAMANPWAPWNPDDPPAFQAC